MNVTFRQLQAFSRVARIGSFVGAADSMSLTQGALSHLVRDLESSVGVRLFERTTRIVRLSKAGEMFLPHAERVLTELGNAELCANDLRAGRAGTVKIGMTPLLAATKFLDLLQAWGEHQPDTQLIPVDTSADVLVELVARGEVDLALGPDRPLLQEVESQCAFEDDLMLVCASSHPLASRRQVRWSELKDEPFIMSGPGAALRTMIDIDYAIRIEPCLAVGHFTTSIALAAAGKGVVLSTAYVRPFLAMYDVKLVPLVTPRVKRRVMLYQPASRSISPAAQNLAEFTLHWFGQADAA
ncbi:LysR family transcriptional regulator [Verticiella sediminum]|uniref:LysR family transcriptional regulator n=1 Tax=Verticiella sediminum TaxID=1247510 RepID=A0A556B100_9BURK|nr:LysR family transcriptional regulator [Verticiella sediminum]TSH98842.1 LysR family transcriptional regulator [Verticiella sediminum]